MPEPDQVLPLPSTYRAALAAKGALLLSMGLGLVGLGVAALQAEHLVGPLRLAGAAFFGFLGGFLAWASSLAFRDVVGGRALRSTGAVALASRRAGYSLQLPGGRFVEFILVNPYPPLVPGRSYTVTYGQHSGVIVARPEREFLAPAVRAFIGEVVTLHSECGETAKPLTRRSAPRPAPTKRRAGD